MIHRICKLEYYIQNMCEQDKSEIIYLIDSKSELDFCIFNVNAVTDFKKMKPVSGDSFEAFEYQNAKYLYTSCSLRFESIFTRINEIFIQNNIAPIFPDPTNLEECFKIRKDMIMPMSHKRANELFGVDWFREFIPPKYNKE